ncbi:MAG: homoserine dehydrogenase [Actinomycetaceae bacterium]|nr:homoserine dehydrogenase [Actinomycetaceae bacterium]
MANSLKIALLGCGTVGSEVVRLLQQNAEIYRNRCGRPLEIIGIAVADPKRARPTWVDSHLLTTDASSIIERADIVIELIGGIGLTAQLVESALASGKSVVTGNKAALATHGEKWFTLAEQRGARIGYEAAVAGAVPIVAALQNSLAGDRVRSFAGILNGTTNFMLQQMGQGQSYEDALTKAQQLGYAEADPTADVEGYDAAAKCALLANLAFGTAATLESVPTQGIKALTVTDNQEAAAFRQVIKLVAVGILGEDAAYVGVLPASVPARSQIGQTGGANNAVRVCADAAGILTFSGAGAGGAPTASAVLGDLVRIASGTQKQHTPKSAAGKDPLKIRELGEYPLKYRLRTTLRDPHVLPELGAAKIVSKTLPGEDDDRIFVLTNAITGGELAEIKRQITAAGSEIEAEMVVLDAN